MPEKSTKLQYTLNKHVTRTQYGALCYRKAKNKKAKVLLVTSRRTGRWIIPKGWPIKGKSPAQSALREAFEEAGVKGNTFDKCLGHFDYGKRIGDEKILHCVVEVYPVKVDSLTSKFPEYAQRRRKWVSLDKAVKQLSDSALKPIIRKFNPKHLP